ncbi:MAG: hypothetical protein J0H83_06645 [Candidatus Melainabacteria bacterium]|nr:hypothetical protein [Candidatus Melainabacteria bacterium]
MSSPFVFELANGLTQMIAIISGKDTIDRLYAVAWGELDQIAVIVCSAGRIGHKL